MYCTTFPFLSQDGFNVACETFAHRANISTLANSYWTNIKLKKEAGQTYLVIATECSHTNNQAETPVSVHYDEHERSSDDEQIEEIQEDSDEEALRRTYPDQDGISVEYHILFSPTYQVPVVYFFLCNLPSGRRPDIDTVYQYLVPKETQSHLQSVGVLGGISMGNHPVTDVPAFFIHPCNTAEAVEAIVGKTQVKLDEYLQLWIGVVGPAIGLYVPLELAAMGTGS